MKKYITQNRIAIFSFVAIAAYCFMIASSLGGNWDSFRLGFWMGSGGAANQPVNTTASPDVPKSVHWISLKPEGGYRDFSTKMHNNKDQSTLDARFGEIMVALPYDFDLPRKVVLYNFIDGTLVFILTIIFILLPVKFTRLMLSIKKEIIFNRKNVSRIRSIGIMVILIYIHSLVHKHIHFTINQTLFDFPDYTIFKPSTNIALLVVGTAVLVMAEILSKGLEIKREQELTI
jgi:hypothetical protein